MYVLISFYNYTSNLVEIKTYIRTTAISWIFGLGWAAGDLIYWNSLIWVYCWNDDVIKWKHFPRYLSFVRGIHRSPVESPHKSQWRGVFMFSLICPWSNGWANNRDADDFRCHRAHYDAIVMESMTVADALVGSFSVWNTSDWIRYLGLFTNIN